MMIYHEFLYRKLPFLVSKTGVAELLPGHPRPTSSLSLSPGWRLWLRWCRRLVFGLPEMTPRGASYASATPIIRPGVFGAGRQRGHVLPDERLMTQRHTADGDAWKERLGDAHLCLTYRYR